MIGYKPLSLRCRRLGACTPFSCLYGVTIPLTRSSSQDIMSCQLELDHVGAPQSEGSSLLGSQGRNQGRGWSINEFWCIRRASGLRTTLGHLMTYYIWPIYQFPVSLIRNNWSYPRRILSQLFGGFAGQTGHVLQRTESGRLRPKGGGV